MMPAELYNWCGEILAQIGLFNADTDDEIYKYIYQMLSIMYKCSKDNKPVLLHDDYREFIEANLFVALENYFKHYKRHKLDLEEEQPPELAASLGINRHMFCKYPFLKEIFQE